MFKSEDHHFKICHIKPFFKTIFMLPLKCVHIICASFHKSISAVTISKQINKNKTTASQTQCIQGHGEENETKRNGGMPMYSSGSHKSQMSHVSKKSRSHCSQQEETNQTNP